MGQIGSKNKSDAVPEPSLRRLAIYHHLLLTLRATGVMFVSTTSIAGPLKLDPTQVRKDLEGTGITGRPKVGYCLADLILRLEEFLGWHQIKEAVLVGAGSLGTALLRYAKFRQLGFHLVAAFDDDPGKVGLTIGEAEVFSLDLLVEYCRRIKIQLGVITTPPEAAQRVADALVEGGIRAIWNFAPVHLQVPQSVLLENEDLYRSLGSLSFRLERMMAAERHLLTEGPQSGVPEGIVPSTLAEPLQPNDSYAKEN
jgi:redox-sensing transcriptional repressor